MRQHIPYKYLITVFTLCLPAFIYAAGNTEPPADNTPQNPPSVRLKRKALPKKEAPPYPVVPHPGRDSDEEG